MSKISISDVYHISFDLHEQLLHNIIIPELKNLKNINKVKTLSNGDFSDSEIKKLEKEYGCKVKRYKKRNKKVKK